MARYPGATWRPIDTKYLPNRHMAAYNRVNLHVAVSEASSIHSVFNRLGAASSHFYVRKNGTVEQYIDTAYQAEADLEGNDATISIETQGGVHDPDNEPWTNEQIEALAQIYAWAVKTHGIPLQVASTSKTDNTSRGLSWHRLGIDGNFPALPDPGAGRLQRGGGMHYSKSFGKLCPGRGKIRQVNGIYNRAVQILTPAPTPEPSSTKKKKTGSKPMIYRAGGYPALGIYAHNGGFVVLETEEEVVNLTKVGVPIVWVGKRTLDGLIADARGLNDY